MSCGTSSCVCVAPDFVSHFSVLIRQHPTGLRSSVGGSGHDREAGPGAGVQAPSEAVLVTVAEVRDLLAAGSSGADDRRGCGESAGRPQHNPADTHGSQGRRTRRVGGVEVGRGRLPLRVDAATKSALLDLVQDALDAGWELARACTVLELPARRVHRWQVRRHRGELADKAPGGGAVHSILESEEREILALFDEWGDTDRSHRKLAHRGSYLHRVWVSPSTVRRVLHLADRHFRPLPKPGPSKRKRFPEWADYRPSSVWIYDTTHFSKAKMAVLIIEDLVSRKWITHVVSSEETSTQVQVGFTQALELEGLLEQIQDRQRARLVDPTVDDEARPILLAVSDNGPQMTSGSTREFMAMCAIAQHFGRPGTPTDQAWIETLNGHDGGLARTVSGGTPRSERRTNDHWPSLAALGQLPPQVAQTGPAQAEPSHAGHRQATAPTWWSNRRGEAWETRRCRGVSRGWLRPLCGCRTRRSAGRRRVPAGLWRRRSGPAE